MMKKFVAGKGAAGLILAGMMVSSGAMAAAGDVVTGGSGTVKINVPLVTSTCTVTVPTEVNFDPINKNDLKSGYSTGKDFDITFSHCAGKTVQMSTIDSAGGSGATPDVLGEFNYPSAVHASIKYFIQVNNPGGEITGGEVFRSGTAFNMSGQKPLIITPGSDDYKLSPTVMLLVNGTKWLENVDSISGSFTYNVTYM
ncbi:TPA_asm: type 1 fimbrial protein [Salmonella enterica]|uniref:fimbrial protein n=1 Tax=Salmonella enterica TaxID=28901 RepID=UPI00126DB83F|nr:type 1 fimbrial protein [Salmonella enterica subsp. enterica serovar Napoli]ECD4177131.1 type 1 fimbrial protein [Salmonella enterica subsp. enterica serovar Napoli]EDW8759123.1 type 1 fimbrial protein [Salmonella enterica subsp. enterica]HAC6718783.1 type 1 fimbrial protein [Salmonella enterica]HBC0206890.1 type 1 fimbrial protein [Salmonella enterica subsp. enterica serovar Napoli]